MYFMTRKMLAVAIMFASLALTSCQVPDSTSAAPATQQPSASRINYGSSNWQYADVYKTRHRQVGVIVFVHGGAWMSGGSTWGEIPSWIKSQSSQGWTIISLSYRLGSPYVLDDMTADVSLAVSHIKGLKAYRNLPLFLSGHSAGATLALRSSIGNSAVSGLVVASAPIEFRNLALSKASIFGYKLSYIVNNALGCQGEINGELSCSEETIARYDLSQEQIAKLPPVYMVAGAMDDVILPSWSVDWYNELVSIKGDSLVWFDYVENTGHSADGANHAVLAHFLKVFSKK